MRNEASDFRHVIVLLFFISSPVFADEIVTPDQAITFETVLELRSDVQKAEAEFIQSQYLRSLTEPIVSVGTMRYEAPSFVVMTVKEPRYEQFVYDGEMLEIRSGDQPEVRAVRANKRSALAVFLKALTSMLAGNREAIEQNFTHEYSAVGEAWTLHLKPILKKVQRRVSRVEFEGTRAVVRKIVLVMKNGNQTILRIDENP